MKYNSFVLRRREFMAMCSASLFMMTSKSSIAAGSVAGVTTLASGLKFPEGPVVLKDGSVVIVEILGDQLTRIAPNGQVSKLVDLGPGPNGIAVGPDGALYVVTNGGKPGNTHGGSVQRFDVRSGKKATLYTQFNGAMLKGPNDLVFDEWGDFWFTDFAAGKVYCARNDGSELQEIAQINGANGIALAPDRRTLYVVQAFERKIASLRITSRGSVEQQNGTAKVATLATLEDGLDSMKVEAGGNLVIASGEAGLTVVSPQGAVLGKTGVADLRVTNLAFGGADMRTAFVTGNVRGSTEGQVVSMSWPRAGLKLLS